MSEIPEEFWPPFVAKLKALGEVYNPVTVNRLYPFLVSHLPAKMVEAVFSRAQERGLIAVDTVEIDKQHSMRVVRPL